MSYLCPTGDPRKLMIITAPSNLVSRETGLSSIKFYSHWSEGNSIVTGILLYESCSQ